MSSTFCQLLVVTTASWESLVIVIFYQFYKCTNKMFKGDIHSMVFIADYVRLYSRVPAWVLVSGGIGRAFRVTIQLLFHEELRQSDCAGTETSIVTMIICHWKSHWKSVWSPTTLKHHWNHNDKLYKNNHTVTFYLSHIQGVSENLVPAMFCSFLAIFNTKYQHPNQYP